MLICGLMRSFTPTSLRSMVWYGLALLCVTDPVTKGTSWPTRIDASALSRVSRVGVDSRLKPLLPFSALTSMAN